MQILRRYWIFAPHQQRRNASACMGGCLGGYVRPPPAALPEKVNRAYKKNSNRQVRAQSAFSSEDWWMSSSHGMGDNGGALDSQALRHYSRALNKSHASGSASSNSSKSSFENHALTHWQKQRKEWVGSQKSQPRKLREPVIRWNATYEELLGTSRPFVKPVPLSEMVDFLVDVWEREGLYG
uniref:Gag1-like clamp domain-containing protein n=2 Tax=Physcomitrium patens TaxID=3218 RepID=A0A2K1IHF9_PHYPA|nr:hypothetical protein PHYPA_029306 [Physcomitrium patens]